MAASRRFQDMNPAEMASRGTAVKEERSGPACDYVLMTAAHNEEAFIEGTIQAVVAQTVRPKRWIVVSDGSTDKTNDIAESYAKNHEFIHILKLTRPPGRSFGSKGMALEKGSELLEGLSFDFIGNLDADITVEPSYFEALMACFDRDPQLGIAAGLVYEQHRGEFRSRAANRIDSVSHGAQLVRRECYHAIGGYSVLKHGGEDWYAQQSAKMRGWRAETIPALKVCHARHTGTATSVFKRQFRAGRVDYSLGSAPLFELFKCAVRVAEEPWVLGAATRLLGFLWSAASREKRPVSSEFVDFLRKEQKGKIVGIFNGSGRARLPRPPRH